MPRTERDDYLSEVAYTAQIIEGVMVITGTGHGRTVTNDAHNILEKLHEQYGAAMPKIVIYLDTNGTWDGIEHRDGQLVEFYSLGGRDYKRAIAKAKARKR